MADDQKDNKGKEEKKAEEKSADIVVGKKEEKEEKEISAREEVMKKAGEKKQEILEELPDDIKKKLEQQAGKSKKPYKKRKKKHKTNISVGKAFIKATYNNVIVTLTDLNGDTISWASAGVAGFKGAKKSTPYAAGIVTRIAVEKAKLMGLKEVSVFVNGVGTGRESAVRALNANGLIVTIIKDITPAPHNGCRQRKPRRV